MFSSEIQKIANDVERIANNMNGESGGGSGSTSGGELVIPMYNIDGQTVTCNMTFSEIEEAIDTGRCVCAIFSHGTIANLAAFSGVMIAFVVTQVSSTYIKQTAIVHDIDNNIIIEMSQYPDEQH